MKKQILFAAMLLLNVLTLLPSFAQAPPQAFKYQSIVRNISGNPMSNTAISLRATIHSGSAIGPSLYQEIHSVTTNQFGLINLEIGNGTIVSGIFTAISWVSGTTWIEIEADFGNGFVPMGTSQLLSVPYALNCGNNIVGATGATGSQGIAGNNGTNGMDGATGTTGSQGIAGNNGTNGMDGATGATGSQGIAGNNGTNGMDGATGTTGSQGIAGNNGTNGMDGATGATGSQGIAGNNGTNGMDGATGATGSQGIAGNNGTNGMDGATGANGSQGIAGNNGTNGMDGATGASGSQGIAGNNGTNGMDGATGATGSQGIAGNNGTNGMDGATGATGSQGIAGTNGTAGATGTISEFAMFFGLTTGTGNLLGTDYPATIAVKTVAGSGRVPFPQNGPAAGIVRIDNTSFTLPDIGTYEITFSVHTVEMGQLQLELNGFDLAETVAANMNPTAGGHPIIGNFLITTTALNSILCVVNSSGNTSALTVTIADGANTHANSQSLIIKKIL